MLLNIQLLPARCPGLDIAEAVARLSRLAKDVSVTEGVDQGAYVNIALRADHIVGLWIKLREQLQADAALAGAAIVVCQGGHGWDDYLLLHHFDPLQALDELA